MSHGLLPAPVLPAVMLLLTTGNVQLDHTVMLVGHPCRGTLEVSHLVHLSGLKTKQQPQGSEAAVCGGTAWVARSAGLRDVRGWPQPQAGGHPGHQTDGAAAAKVVLTR